MKIESEIIGLKLIVKINKDEKKPLMDSINNVLEILESSEVTKKYDETIQFLYIVYNELTRL